MDNQLPVEEQLPNTGTQTTTQPEQPSVEGTGVLNGEPTDPPEEGQTPEEEEEEEWAEIQYNGKTYQVPKDLHDGFLMQSDYTRKTMTLAEQRKALEAQQAALQQSSEYQAALLQDLATVKAYDEQLKVFESVDWAALSKQDPNRAQSLWMTYTQLKEGKSQAQQTLQQREQAWITERQQLTARQLEHANAVLRNEIKGWGPELANKLGQFAVSDLGFTQAEVSQVNDPRVIKLIHKAYLGSQLIKEKTPAQKVKSLKPNRTVSGSGGTSAPNPENMSMDEWVKYRNKQLNR